MRARERIRIYVTEQECRCSIAIRNSNNMKCAGKILDSVDASNESDGAYPDIRD